jgi:hypothetical protein
VLDGLVAGIVRKLPKGSKRLTLLGIATSLDATDEPQLLQATARGRCILTCHIADFVALVDVYPYHGGIVLAHQRDWSLPALIAAVDTLLSTAAAEDWTGQVRRLIEWRR